MNITDEITKGENLMNTKIETFLTYMLVLFLTIAFESSLRATPQKQGLDLNFSGTIQSKQAESSAIKITDLSNHEIPSIIWNNVPTYKSDKDTLKVSPPFVEIKVEITGTPVNNSGLTVQVQRFGLVGPGLKNFPGQEDLITSSKMGSGTSTFAWNTAWSLVVTTKDGTAEKLSEAKKTSAALHPDTTKGKIYHIRLHPMLQFPISEQEDAGGQINGDVRLIFVADLS